MLYYMDIAVRVLIHAARNDMISPGKNHRFSSKPLFGAQEYQSAVFPISGPAMPPFSVMLDTGY